MPPTDWILIAEALSCWNEQMEDPYIRHHRAQELLVQITVMHGFDDPSEFIRQAPYDEDILKQTLSAD